MALDLIAETAASNGWIPVSISRRPHMIAVAVVPAGTTTSDAIHFDIFKGVAWFGIPLLSPEDLDAGSELVDGICRLTPGYRTLVTVLHHLSWSGTLAKEKYRADVRDMLDGPRRQWLLDELRERHSPALARAVQEDLSSLSSPNRARSWRLRVAFLVGRLRRSPLAAGSHVTRYALGQVASFLRPPGLVGRPDEPVAAWGGATLDVDLACRVAPMSIGAYHVRVPSTQISTHAHDRYRRELESQWAAFAPVRWVMPTLFLWLSAKRNRIVVLEHLPIGVRLLRAIGVSWAGGR